MGDLKIYVNEVRYSSEAVDRIWSQIYALRRPRRCYKLAFGVPLVRFNHKLFGRKYKLKAARGRLLKLRRGNGDADVLRGDTPRIDSISAALLPFDQQLARPSPSGFSNA